MPEKFEIKVSSLYVLKRIDSYLTEAFRGKYSRKEIKKALDEGEIFLNKKIAKPKNSVREGDVITGNFPVSLPSALIPEQIPLSVIYEDESLLVIDKPAGMVVHPGAGNKKGTLVQALLGRSTTLSTLGGAIRPGIVHRLDKDTSGLLLVAKTNEAHRALQAQFASRSLSKIYTALVKGRVEFDEGRVDASLGPDPKNPKKRAVSQGLHAKEALTHYRVLKRFRNQTLLLVTIVTGRTHQIRVHLAHLGTPVVGDKIYGDRVTEDRLALHASKIEFLHPKDGRIMKFESPLPEAIQTLIKKSENF